MNLKECYEALEGNYEGVVGRLRNENLVKKFVIKFLNDKSYETLLASLKDENYEEAFRAVHTLKGVCQNLSFDRLGNSSQVLTEALRGGKKTDVTELVEAVSRDYEQTVNAIRALDGADGV